MPPFHLAKSLEQAPLETYYFYNMEYDKYIGRRKLTKIGLTEEQCVQLERRAILNIRSMSQSLNSIFQEISMYSASMVSPTASPIKHQANSNASFSYTPLKQFILAPPIKQQSINSKSQNNPQVKPMKKKSVPSVHFTNYMKPIGNVSLKFKEILEKQMQMKELQQERQAQTMRNLKLRTNQQYNYITPKYQTYQHVESAKKQAIASRIVERQEQQMSGVTFKPKINKNIQINEPFEQRLLQRQKKKQERQTQIIKQAIKGETYHPKINSHKQGESKIKSIWAKSSKKPSESVTSKSFRDESSQFVEIMGKLDSEKTVKMKTISQFEFINKK